MSTKSDPSQGTVPAPATPRRLPTPKPLTAAQVRAQMQPALDAADKAETTPRPPQPLRDPQDFRKG